MGVRNDTVQHHSLDVATQAMTIHNPNAVDDAFESLAISVGEQQITDFARQFDPQPYHLDKAAGDASIFGGLCASGWQVAALGTRLVGEALRENGYPFVALTEVESLRWRRPTFVDEDLKARVTVHDLVPNSWVPGCSTATVHADIMNENDDIVAVMDCSAAVEIAEEEQ